MPVKALNIHSLRHEISNSFDSKQLVHHVTPSVFVLVDVAIFAWIQYFAILLISLFCVKVAVVYSILGCVTFTCYNPP